MTVTEIVHLVHSSSVRLWMPNQDCAVYTKRFNFVTLPVRVTYPIADCIAATGVSCSAHLFIFGFDISTIFQ